MTGEAPNVSTRTRRNTKDNAKDNTTATDARAACMETKVTTTETNTATDIITTDRATDITNTVRHKRHTTTETIGINTTDTMRTTACRTTGHIAAPLLRLHHGVRAYGARSTPSSA